MLVRCETTAIRRIGQSAGGEPTMRLSALGSQYRHANGWRTDIGEGCEQKALSREWRCRVRAGGWTSPAVGGPVPAMRENNGRG